MDKIKKIPHHELKKWIQQKKKMVIVEVLIRENYDFGHIPNAINIPADIFEKAAPKILKKEDIIILYCRDKSCKLSPRCAEHLVKLGYTKVYHYEDGKMGWIQNEEPLQTKSGKHCTLAGCD